MKCIVSGATGFIGRQLCQQLETRGHCVIALSKSGTALDSGRPTCAVDLAKGVPDAGLLHGADVFFHLAGIAHQHAQEPDYTAVNYLGTLRLARAAAAAGIRCFVFLSSVRAMGPSLSSDVRDESAVSTPLDAYSLSKWQAECALREAFSGAGMSVAIVRPVLVYGSKAKGNLQSMATAVRWGLPRPPQGGRRSMIALDDLVELLCTIAVRPPPGLNTWIACGADSYSSRDIYDLLRAALGRRRGVTWLPLWAWKFACTVLDAIVARSGESTYNKLFGWELYSNCAVVRDTGWHPRLRLEDILDQRRAPQRADP